MWLFDVFMNNYISVVLNALLSADRSRKILSQKMTVKPGYLTTYLQIVNFVLEKYATEEIIVKTELVSTRLAQLAGMNLSQNAEY